MTTNILIGVGGTGAKVVESVIHASAAGLGPETLRVGFVDQDQSNGNVARTLQLLEKVAGARDLWRSSGAKHRLGPECDLLRTDIAPLSPNAKVWVPNQGQSITLSRIFGALSDDDKTLFDLLFAKGEAEQDMILDEGYRGRPHIGSAAITSRVEDDDEFWKTLLQLIKGAQGGTEVRLALAGSVFGGTGAAGFPTLARLIRQRLEKEDIRRNVNLGGVLMLPYFAFDPPESEEGRAGNVARSEHLLMQSRGALNYYDALFKDEHVFDELYLVGWNRPFEMGYHRPGAQDQENPALAPELIAALGACRFFHPNHKLDQPASNRVYVSARESDDAIGWADLPSPDPEQHDAPYHKFGRMLRFAVAWKHWASLLAQPRGMWGKLMQHDPWYKAQKVNDIDYRDEPPAREMKTLTEYIDEMLIWAATSQVYTGRSNTGFRLWKLDEMFARAADFANPQEPVKIRADLSEADYARAFDNVVIKKPSADDLPGASELLARLNESPVGGEHRALGHMVAALHAYSSVPGSRSA